MSDRAVRRSPRPADVVAPTTLAGPDAAVDWRFLLPSTVLGRVAIVGLLPIEVEEAVRAAADSVSSITDPGEQERFDTVLCQGDDLAQIRLALSLVGPSGSLRLHAPARSIRSQARRLLTDAGCTVTTWWARPSTGAAQSLVALDDPTAAATAIRAVGGRTSRVAVDAALARSGIAAVAAADVSMLAVAPRADGAADTRSAVAAPEPGRPVAVLITPRYASSRAVVGMATDPSGRKITTIAKLARSAADQDHLVHESRMLDAFLASSLDDHHVPTGHHLSSHGSHIALVEHAVDGDPLDRRHVRRDPAGALRAGLTWLEQVPMSDPTPLDGARFDGMIARPLAAIEAASQCAGGSDQWASRAEALLLPLRGTELPVVFEHGDLSHPNIFVDRSGHLVVIDWEQARTDGLPLHDALFFVAYLAESIDRPADDDDLAASYRRAFEPSGWARADVAVHVERLHLDPRLVPLLNLACWTRMFAQALGTPPTARTRHRADCLWRAAIHDAERCAR